MSKIKSSVENQQHSMEVPSLINIPWFLTKEVLFRMVSCQTASMGSQKYRH